MFVYGETNGGSYVVLYGVEVTQEADNNNKLKDKIEWTNKGIWWRKKWLGHSTINPVFSRDKCGRTEVAVGQIIVTIMPLVEGLEAKLIPFHDHFV
jgi:hypothetical protein